MKRELVFGVGLNDADYRVSRVIEGRDVRCPFHLTWKNMLRRCYSEKYLSAKPSYIGCTVCEERKTFTAFRGWMASQDWEGKSLDKDLIIPGNRVYCPEACIFIESWINSFLIEDQAKCSNLPTGVYFDRSRGKYQSYIKERGKRRSLGRFMTAAEAHAAWRQAKSEIAMKIASTCSDPRLASLLRSRYGRQEANRWLLT